MRRRRLFWKYTTFFVLLVTGELLVSGVTEIYFSYRENQAALVTLQREKALAAASRIELFIEEIEKQMGWVTQPQRGAAATALEQRRFDFFRLQRQVPAITEVSYIDATGHEQVRVSRLAMDAIGSGIDRSRDPRFAEARAHRVYRGPVDFRKESEPYMAIAIAEMGSGGQPGGVTAAEVNLKFIWDVVSQIRIGKAGQAFVVDGQGVLIAHPDISLVLQKTDLTRLEQVRGALAGAGRANEPAQEATIARNLRGQQVLTAHAAIPALGWTVFVEQPLEEAFAPLTASVKRTVLLLVLGVLLSVGASLMLARTLARPIRALQAGAEKIGEGHLGDRIEVRTGDELEVLADQFNRMATRLQESYAGLERKVEERTRDLTEALEQQTATAEILRAISSSPTDLQPILDAVAQNAGRVCDATDCLVLRVVDDAVLQLVAGYGDISRDMTRIPINPDWVAGRAVLERRTIHVPDLAAELVDYPASRSLQERAGNRTTLVTPMLREGAAIGAIVIRRLEVRPFTDKQIALLETFANQAVIAIENVRLFQQLQARTQDLSQSLEETGALSEIIQAVSASLDLREILDTVALRAIALSDADGCGIFELSPGHQAFDVVVSQGLSREFVSEVQAIPVGGDHGTINQATAAGRPVQIPDVEQAHDYPLRSLFLREGLRSVLTVPMGGGDVVRGIVVVRRRAGEFDERIVSLMTALANQSKVAIANADLFREIEEKSRLLEVANRHKSEFLANMSHELRTPLNAIIGFSEVLLQRMFGELNAKQEEYLQDVLSSGRHLLSLINDILDLSKVEAGRMDLELARFDLPQAMQDTLVLVRERAARHGIDLQVDVDARLGPFVADERKLKQVLLNLLSNAVKFTPEGGRIEVRAVPIAGAVEISVADTGIGIAPEHQELIFEEFRQVGGDYAHKREGTGLGLTLARKLVELHGGRIWVKSQPGLGSTFTFSIPERPWPASSS